MTGKDVFDAIGDISDKYLTEALEENSDILTDNPDEGNIMHTRKTHEKGVIIAVAAALALLLGISAFASDISIADFFKTVFTGTPAGKEIYEHLSAGEMSPCTSNGTTITPLAAIADNKMCYLRLRIDAPAGTTLCIPDAETEGHLQLASDTNFADLIVNKNTGIGESGESIVFCEDPVPGDGSLEAVLIFAGQMGNTHFNDGKTRTVNIHNIWLQENDKNYSVVLSGEWSFDVTFPKGETKVLPVKGLKVHGLSDGAEVTLKELSISPLSLEASFEFTAAEEKAPDLGSVLVVMKNGTEITSRAGDGEDSRTWTHFSQIFNTPINVEEVDYIQLGGQIIQVN